MKLLLAIVQDEDATKVMNALNRNGYLVTKLSSTGGFLKSGNTTLLMGMDEQCVDHALEIIERHSKSRKQTINADMNLSGGMMMPLTTEITVGGATVFVLDVAAFKKF